MSTIPVDQGPVLIVEDHDLLAQTLGVALNAEGFDVELAQLTSGGDVQAQAERLHPSVVLLDLDLGEGHDSGEALVPGLRRLGAAVIVVSASTDPLRLGTCLELGAAGVMSKACAFEEVVDAVRCAAQNRAVMSEPARYDLLLEMRRRRGEQRQRLAPFERLTPREGEVLALLMEGLSAEGIATRFVVSEATVRTQIRGVLTKLGVNSQLAAVAEARRVGWQQQR